MLIPLKEIKRFSVAIKVKSVKEIENKIIIIRQNYSFVIFVTFAPQINKTIRLQDGLNSTLTVGCRELTTTDYRDFKTTTLAEFPGLLISLILIDIIGRKLCLAIEFGIGAVAIGVLMVCTSRTVLIVFIFIVRGKATFLKYIHTILWSHL